MNWPAEPVTVIAPASSANLGPGFDSLGLALGLHDTLEVRIVPAGTTVEVRGLGPVGGVRPDGTAAEVRGAGADSGFRPDDTAVEVRGAGPVSGVSPDGATAEVRGAGPGRGVSPDGATAEVRGAGPGRGVSPDATTAEVRGAGPGRGVSPDATEDNLIVRAMRAGFAAFGGVQPRGLALSCQSAIPQGFGLGSSAAAIVSGILAARALAGPAGAAVSGDGVLALATELEGHPDNVAACLLGGLTISWTSAAGPHATRLTPLPELALVLCVPASPVLTETARKALPPQVPHADAAANSARTALLIAALTSRPELLLAGTEDFLHQGYRADAMPATARLLARLREAGVAAVISGAGPSVLALTVDGRTPGHAEVVRIAGDAATPWRVLSLPVDVRGAHVLAHQDMS